MNGGDRTQNAERRTQNAERRTQNAERRTQKKDCWAFICCQRVFSKGFFRVPCSVFLILSSRWALAGNHFAHLLDKINIFP